MRICRAGKVAIGLLVLLGVSAVLWPVVAQAQSRSQLQRRLSAEKEQAAAARANVKAQKAKTVKARNRLVETQKELAAAEARLKRAQRQLRQTRDDLVVTRKKLDETIKRLVRHEEAMRARVLAMYRNQDPSYTEVLLRATSFEDFANRAEFTKRLARCDETQLIRIVDDKMEVEDQQELLRRQEQRQIDLEKKVAKEKVVVAQKNKQAEALLAEAKTDMVEAQRQLDQQEAEIGAIESMLKQLEAQKRRARSSGGGGGASYSGRHYEGSWSGSLGKPVSGPITSHYGMRRHPITGTMRFHDGVDISAPAGTTIHCAAAGRVISTGWKGPYGLTVIVDHGSGVQTMYAHCQRGSVRVSPGQEVGRGQALAGVDSTGWSTGNHLHFTVFKNGRHVNPLSSM
jgi:murein DD-endopeptidase MepM/ murein hydrolase activator NlpD